MASGVQNQEESNMARYTGPKERIERRIGERLYIKGERSQNGKTAITKKPYPPGMHGRKGARKLSEYGLQLKSKQKVRNTYRLMEKQFKNTIKAVIDSKKDPYTGIISSLEHRLDNVVFRMGLAQSRDQARQVVNHGHILVNGKKLSIPSHTTKKGDKISIREASKPSPYFVNIGEFIKKYEAPAWISVDKAAMTGTVDGQPNLEASGIQAADLQAIIEFYSR